VKLSSRGLFAISLLFSLSVIIIVFGATFTEETIGYILSFNLLFLILAIGFRILALALWGLRIVLMSRSLGYQVGFFYSLNMVLAGLLAGTITPGQAGGEPVRVHELYRAGVKVGDATAIVIMERVLDGIILTGMGIDGAEGLSHMKDIGGTTIAQDPKTCTIRSMPEAAIKTEKVDFILKPEEIRTKMTDF